MVLFTARTPRIFHRNIGWAGWDFMASHGWPGWRLAQASRLAFGREGNVPWAREFVIIFSLLLLVVTATPIGPHLGSISPHPLWIPVLLLSSQCGTMAGIAAAAASMALHWLTGMPPQNGGEDIYDYLYRVWREPMLWPVAAVVLGGFQAQQAQRMQALRSRLIEAKAQLRTIGNLAQELRAHCDTLERQIACAADRSIEAGLAALDDVRKAGPEGLGFTLPRAMEILVGTASYLLFTLRDNRLVAAPDFSRVLDDAGKLPRIESLPEGLEAKLVREQRLLSIRRVEDAAHLAGSGLIAVPILSPASDRLIGALLIQSMDPMRLTEETEQSVRALVRELAHALSKDRVLVNFRRDPMPVRLLSLGPGGAHPARYQAREEDGGLDSSVPSPGLISGVACGSE